MTEFYTKVKLDKDYGFLRPNMMKSLKKIDAIIFDCDGVLVDTRDSYDKAIFSTVSYIMHGLTQYMISDRTFYDEMIFIFRKSGGFNNDWDISYGILMSLLANLPKKIRKILKKHVRKKSNSNTSLYERFYGLRARMNGEIFKKEVENSMSHDRIIPQIGKLVELLGSNGIDSLKESLISISEDSKKSIADYLDALSSFFLYPGDVKQSIIVRIFEELFCGNNLFQETYDIKPRFYDGRGYINNEDIIIKPETISYLKSRFGEKMGIVSGSTFKFAKHVLKDVLDVFNTNALFFHDDIINTEYNYLIRNKQVISLKKPNPFALEMTKVAIEPYNSLIYIGDSMEDALMTDKARKKDPRLLFGAAYSHTSLKTRALRSFLEAGCDAVFPSVNDLPTILEKVIEAK